MSSSSERSSDSTNSSESNTSNSSENSTTSENKESLNATNSESESSSLLSGDMWPYIGAGALLFLILLVFVVRYARAKKDATSR